MKVYYKRLGGDVNGGAWHTSNFFLEQELKAQGMYIENIKEADIIYAQENVGGLELFKKYPDKIKIVQLVCSHPDFYCKILKEELDEYKMWDQRPFNWAPIRKEEIELADYVVVYSNFTKKTCIDAGVPKKKIIVIPKGVETGFFTSGNSIKIQDPNNFTVGFAGQMQLIKGLQYLPIDDKDFKTIICGDKTLYLDSKGNKSWQFKKIYDDSPKDSFIDYEKLSKAGMVDFYNMCDVIVVPSIEDSMCMVVLEALSCGVPVICTENTGAGELITHHKEGSIVPIRNPLAIRDEIMYWKEYLNDERVQKLTKGEFKSTEIKKGCRELALKHTMDKYMADIISFLKRVEK